MHEEKLRGQRVNVVWTDTEEEEGSDCERDEGGLVYEEGLAREKEMKAKNPLWRFVVWTKSKVKQNYSNLHIFWNYVEGRPWRPIRAPTKKERRKRTAKRREIRSSLLISDLKDVKL